MLGSAMRIDANQQSKLKDNEVRNGYVVFDADKLQQYYDEQIKPNLKLEREDKKVVVNNAGEVLSTETEGHDGIVIADGADTELVLAWLRCWPRNWLSECGRQGRSQTGSQGRSSRGD